MAFVRLDIDTYITELFMTLIFVYWRQMLVIANCRIINTHKLQYVYTIKSIINVNIPRNDF